MCLACLGSSIVHRQKNGYKLQLAKAIASFAQPLSQLFYSHSHCRCFYCELIEPLHSHQNKAIRDQLPLQCFHLKGWLCESLDIHELSLQAIWLISASLMFISSIEFRSNVTAPKGTSRKIACKYVPAYMGSMKAGNTKKIGSRSVKL